MDRYLAGVDAVDAFDPPSWPGRVYRRRHFEKHGVSVGRDTIEAYDESARATIRAGQRFTYRDPVAGDQRVGYFDAATRRLTALSPDERTIVTHFRCNERYVRRLPDSDCQR